MAVLSVLAGVALCAAAVAASAADWLFGGMARKALLSAEFGWVFGAASQLVVSAVVTVVTVQAEFGSVFGVASKVAVVEAELVAEEGQPAPCP